MHFAVNIIFSRIQCKTNPTKQKFESLKQRFQKGKRVIRQKSNFNSNERSEQTVFFTY